MWISAYKTTRLHEINTESCGNPCNLVVHTIYSGTGGVGHKHVSGVDPVSDGVTVPPPHRTHLNQNRAHE